MNAIAYEVIITVTVHLSIEPMQNDSRRGGCQWFHIQLDGTLKYKTWGKVIIRFDSVVDWGFRRRGRCGAHVAIVRIGVSIKIGRHFMLFLPNKKKIKKLIYCNFNFFFG